MKKRSHQSKGELFIINATIEEYAFGNYYNHRPKAERKLLLNKKELKKLYKEVQSTGLTIIPLRLYINQKGFFRHKIRSVVMRGSKK